MRGERSHGLLDLHFAAFLAARSGLNDPERQVFESLVRDLSAALSEGHSCLPVDAGQRELLLRTRLVSDGARTPLVVCNGRLYLHRYFSYERRLACQVRALAGVVFPVPGDQGLLDSCFGPDDGEEDLQKKAAATALRRAFCIISGGPGTGKTSTVVKIIGLLLQAAGTGLQVALAAPTGKAAMRLSRSVGASVAGLPLPETVKAAIPTEAVTLHRLLGVRRDSPRFRHDGGNPLPWDLVVVDEASMVDLALMSKLVDALKPGARLLLLGDKDQLASVESGAVLADLIRALPENTVELRKTYRFDTTIRDLAAAVNRGDHRAALDCLADPGSASVERLETPAASFAAARYLRYMEQVASAGKDEYAQVFAAYNGFRVLCAVHKGERGVDGINAAVERHLSAHGRDCLGRDWYPGRPVLITRNDYSLDLFNGDTGICLPDPADGTPKVWFERPDGTMKACLPYRLPPCETAYALTVHKCQGSEFDEVLVVLPEGESRVLSRELVYTAVTRARKKVLVAGGDEVVRQALTAKIRRFSGLQDMVSGSRSA